MSVYCMYTVKYSLYNIDMYAYIIYICEVYIYTYACIAAAISEWFICVPWSKPGPWGMIISQSSMGFLMGLLTDLH